MKEISQMIELLPNEASVFLNSFLVDVESADDVLAYQADLIFKSIRKDVTPQQGYALDAIKNYMVYLRYVQVEETKPLSKIYLQEAQTCAQHALTN